MQTLRRRSQMGSGLLEGTISFASNSMSKTYGDSAFTNVLTNTGDGTVTYSSSDTSVATVNSGGYVTIVRAGSCTITATVTDGTDYTYPVKTASYSLSVAKASRTLGFADSHVVLDTNSSVTKTATPSAGSGDGAITYSIDSTAYATINSSTGAVTSNTADGSAVVTATIAEGTNYLSATASYNLYVFATVHDFSYTGGVQSLVLPGGNYRLQCWGAQGGGNSADSSVGILERPGGKGGYSEGTLYSLNAIAVDVCVGGQGSSSAGGYNGGGSTTGSSTYNNGGEYGTSRMGGGGGATDIRSVNGDLLSRMIVAGGGSGGAMCYRNVTSQQSVGGTAFTGYYIGNMPGYVKGAKLVAQAIGSFWYTDGSIRSHSGFILDTYSVTPNTTYYFTASFGDNTNINYVAWVDSSGTIISYESYGGSNTSYSDQAVTAPSGASYMYLNKRKDDPLVGIGERPQALFKYYRFPVSGGVTYSVAVPPVNNSDPDYNPIHFGGAMSGSMIENGSTYSWNTPGQGFSGNITIPAGATYMYITVDQADSAPTVSFTSTSSDTCQQDGYVGGGTNGGGYSSYYGSQTSAGAGGAFGQGASASVTNYRYCGGAGGGGWYGGGSGRSDNDMNSCRLSGGGSGWVNIAANASYRPSGYTGLELSSGTTYAGDTSFPAPGGGNETGHAGNGYVRITRL